LQGHILFNNIFFGGNMNQNLKRNISIGYIYSFFLQLNITSAIWVLFLVFKGMSLIEIGILESIYHITGLCFEMPSGALADLKGRKFCVVLGRAVNVLSCILMITSNSFLGLAISFIFSSAAMNLNSGAAEALIFDSLKELGEEDKYKKIWGQLAFIMSIAQGIAVLLGGILADINFLYAYIFGTIVQMVALVISFNFNEPTIIDYKANKHVKKEKMLINQLITSYNVLKLRKNVFYTIMFSALMGSLQTTVFFYSQQYFSSMGYTKTVIAIICAVGSLMEAFSCKYAYRIEDCLNFKGSILAISILNIFVLVGLSLFKRYSVIFYILTFVTGGMAFTIFSNYINMRIPSEHRATILSFESLCFSIFMICIFPLFGVVAEYTGFTLTFVLTAITYIPAMIFLMIKLNNHTINDLEEI